MGVELLEALKTQDKYRKLFHAWSNREFGRQEKEEKFIQELREFSEKVGVKDNLIVGSFDYRDFSLAFFTDNIFDVSGLPAEYFKRYGLEATMSMFHHEDREEVLKFQKMNIDTYDSLSLNEKKTFGASYTYRWIHRLTGEEIWQQTSIVPFMTDENGNIILDLQICMRLNAPPDPAKFHWEFHYTADNGALIKMAKQFEDVAKNKLSKREYEVAQLIVNGVQASDIAKELGISPNTLVTHRKNIMKKLKINSSLELVRIMMHKS
ncbi:LuxR family transcriptional regulator [Litoribacter ruber]|uniref:LuxR family transcriptional regulator n=1 Tax=Litoribacter ruber TaxID=702568 RepID=A0AAP2G0W1_9BACT|nr:MULTISPECIES: helix-turn-helix transcriptional regulator [Litoribacter]MBS9523564.1 LuxR family transcriptional regulator [Litoribacter alkaliphilus]MBT0812019.1 LuxR family transcriptional regulator [Litoribacter ruber]